MKIMFDGAYPGKLYKTRDEKKAIFLYFNCETDPHSYNCWIEGVGRANYTVNGKFSSCPNLSTLFDIVGEWPEEVDEERLRDIAYNETAVIRDQGDKDYFDGYDLGDIIRDVAVDSFIKGYIKANEEK